MTYQNRKEDENIALSTGEPISTIHGVMNRKIWPNHDVSSTARYTLRQVAMIVFETEQRYISKNNITRKKMRTDMLLHYGIICLTSNCFYKWLSLLNSTVSSLYLPPPLPPFVCSCCPNYQVIHSTHG